MTRKSKPLSITKEEVGYSKKEGEAQDDSIVTKLLFVQYQSAQTERLVFSSIMRVFWFLLLLCVAVTPYINYPEIGALAFVAIALFMVTFSSSRRMMRLERNIRDSLVRLDPGMEDYYIRTLHESRELPSDLFISMLHALSKYDNLVWLISFIYIAILRIMT